MRQLIPHSIHIKHVMMWFTLSRVSYKPIHITMHDHSASLGTTVLLLRIFFLYWKQICNNFVSSLHTIFFCSTSLGIDQTAHSNNVDPNTTSLSSVVYLYTYHPIPKLILNVVWTQVVRSECDARSVTGWRISVMHSQVNSHNTLYSIFNSK